MSHTVNQVTQQTQIPHPASQETKQTQQGNNGTETEIVGQTKEVIPVTQQGQHSDPLQHGSEKI